MSVPSPNALPIVSSGTVAASDGSATIVPVFQANQVNQDLTGTVTVSNYVATTGTTNTNTLTTTNSQGTPAADPNSSVNRGVGINPNNTNGFGINANTASTGIGLNPTPKQTVGVSAPIEDGALPTTNSVQTAVNAQANSVILPEPNVLDEYASYTYSLSLYLLSADEARNFISTGNKNINNWRLLIQSGGIPTTDRFSADPGNQIFSNDFYIDNLEIKTSPTLTGTQAVHSAFEMSFTITEPNGITLVQNLYLAADQLYKQTGAKGNVNYIDSTYCMVIKFYGYDQDGVQAVPIRGGLVNNGNQSTQNSGTTPNSTTNNTNNKVVIEKYYPIRFTELTFRSIKNAVEYHIKAAPLGQTHGYGQGRGVVPFPTNLSGENVGQVLGASTTVPAGTNTDGRTNTGTTTASRNSTTVNGTEQGITTDTASPNATAVPNQDPNSVFTGLTDILNANQKKLVEAGQQDYADQYQIIFAPQSLMNLKVKKPGTVDQKQTSMQTPDSGQKLNPDTNKVNNNSQTIQVTAGKPIVQVIDEIIRQSEYVYNQQTVTVDPTTGKTVPNPNVGSETKWYNILVQSVPIGNNIDTKRNMFPQKITYAVVPYELAIVPSEYFPSVKFKGVHKSYNYWFTGQNTQILEYEQTYNYLYTLTISSQTGIPEGNKFNTVDSRELYSRLFATRSGEADMGSSSNEPGANLADGLFNIGDFVSIGLRIVGDPAWLQQDAQVSSGSLATVNTDAFNQDGTINFNSKMVLFDVSWNRPVDYDFNTGIAPVTAQNVSSAGGGLTLPKENQTYIAIQVVSYFQKGRFTQELIGALLTGVGDATTVRNNTAGASPGTVPLSPGEAAAAQVGSNYKQPQINLANSGTRLPTTSEGEVNGITDTPGKATTPNPATTSPSNTNQNTPALPAKPPTNPTSTGGINESPGTKLPPVLGQLTLNNGRVATFYDTNDPFVSQNATAYAQSLAKGATPVAPQLIKKDDA